MASIVAVASAVVVAQTIQEYPGPKDTYPHDIAPAADGGAGTWATSSPPARAPKAAWQPSQGQVLRGQQGPETVVQYRRRPSWSPTSISRCITLDVAAKANVCAITFEHASQRTHVRHLIVEGIAA